MVRYGEYEKGCVRPRMNLLVWHDGHCKELNIDERWIVARVEVVQVHRQLQPLLGRIRDKALINTVMFVSAIWTKGPRRINILLVQANNEGWGFQKQNLQAHPSSPNSKEKTWLSR
jgi:hypothetical protein